jgi:hypothetical protein
MEDVVRYLEEFVDPTIKDFEQNPTSVRHAFIACVVTYHAVDYLAHPKKPQTLRRRFNKESKAFELVDDVAHAFKHVQAGNPSAPDLAVNDVISRPPAFWGVAVWDLSRWDDPAGGVTVDKNRTIDLLNTVRHAADFLRSKVQPTTQT